MKKNNLKPTAALLGSSVALALCGSANAADNPFQMVEFGDGIAVAAEARDMQGNEVKIVEETGFEYGGDQMGKYADGKVGTGKKDPGVCGTFKSQTCSMAHLPGSSAKK